MAKLTLAQLERHFATTAVAVTSNADDWPCAGLMHVVRYLAIGLAQYVGWQVTLALPMSRRNVEPGDTR